MANDESDALDTLEKEAKEYDKVSFISQWPGLTSLTRWLGRRDRSDSQSL